MSRSDREPVSVIINAYNEAGTIEKEILDIQKKILSRLPGSELIIAEDGSTDGTKEIIARCVKVPGIILLTSVQRKGYAGALKDAMGMAKNPSILFSDTGGKFDFDDFWKLYNLRNEYSLVIGVRSKRTDKLYRRFLTLAYNFVLCKYFRVDLADADSGFRIYSRELVAKLCSEEWVNTALIGSELALRTLFSGGEIGYVDIAYQQRTGVSRGLPPRNTLKVIISVISNFPKLKKTISSASYRKLEA